MKTMADRIMYARSSRGLTQEDLATACSVNPRTIGAWERGENEPRGKSLIKVSEILQVNSEWLATGEGLMRTLEQEVEQRKHTQRMAPPKQADEDQFKDVPLAFREIFRSMKPRPPVEIYGSLEGPRKDLADFVIRKAARMMDGEAKDLLDIAKAFVYRIDSLGD